MSNVSEAASWVMWHLVTHDGAGGHGYSQPNRHGTGGPHTGDYSASGGEVVTIPNWGRVTVHSGDYDCSEACIDCYGFLGIPVGGATYTGNERQRLMATGLFTAYRVGAVTPRDGDILLRSGHTEMVVNGATEQAGFRRSERHTANGRTGDQDGYESTHSALDTASWTWVIRYTGPDKAGPAGRTATAKAAGKTATKATPKVAETEDTMTIVEPRENGRALGFQALVTGSGITKLTESAQSQALAAIGVGTKVITKAQWEALCKVLPTGTARS